MDNNFIGWVLVPTIFVMIPYFVTYIRNSDRRKKLVQLVFIPLVMLLSTAVYTIAGYYHFLKPEMVYELYNEHYLFLMFVYISSSLYLQKIVGFSMEVIFGLRN